jgi:KDO2-lipid IV(A) lauroyltransferase
MSLWRHTKFALEALGFFIATGALRLLSPETASNLGGALGRTFGPRLGISRRARQNIRLALPEKSAAEVEEIVRGMWDNLGRVAAEYPHLDRITAVESGRIELADVSALRDLRDGHRAGITVSAHLGNWEVLPTAGVRNGLDLLAVIREPNNPYVRPLLHRLRGAAGGTWAGKGAGGARQIVAALRAGRVVAMLIDQKLNTGIPLPFFGVEAMTVAAPAQLALRFGCPLVPVRVERTGPARFRISAPAAVPLSSLEAGDRHAAVSRIMGDLNRILEDWIRARPEQWLWLHRRWPDAARRSSGAPPDNPASGF